MSRVTAAAEALGLGRVFDEAKVLRERAVGLNAVLDAARSGADKDRSALIAALAGGGSVAAEEIAERAARFEQWAFEAPASRIMVAAVAAAHTAADAAVAAAAPALFKAMQELTAGVVDESVRLARGLPDGVRDEMAALRSDIRARDAWLSLVGLWGTWSAVHELAKLLRSAGWMPRYDNEFRPVDRGEAYLRHKHPWKIRGGQMPAPLALALCAAAGSEPGLYHPADALGRWTNAMRRAADPEWIAQMSPLPAVVMPPPMPPLTVPREQWPAPQSPLPAAW